jgi:DNA-binding MarR family transcriptional regulator
VAWRSFLNAHAVVLDRVEAALSAASLPPLAWYHVLWPLYRAPERRLRMGELADEVVTIGRTGLSRLVDRIEAAGLLRRESVADDRRGSYAALTPAGVEMLRRMWPVYARAVGDTFVSALGEEEARLLAEALGRVAKSPDALQLL